eukprot:8350176-Lingulodinium_polyedra.AAC.1
MDRAALVAIDRVYRFAEQHRDLTMRRIPCSMHRELELLQGQFFLCASRPLGTRVAPLAFCSDSS